MKYQFENVKLLRVVDGDTFDFEVDLGFKVVIRERFRLVGINTPEIFRPINDAELKHGEAATRYAKGLLESGENHIKLTSHKSSLYGRWEARISIGADDLSELLKKAGYARKEDAEYLAEEADQSVVKGDDA